jgi:hypothetical protein
MAGIDPRRWERAQRLARLLLLVGPGGEDLTRKYLGVLFDREPPRAARPRQVLVVGAGIAGLISALLLARRGHRITIVEANASRVGGRIKTFRNFKDPAQYAEAGAMRLPEFHPMVLALVDDLGLRRRLFYNVDVKPGSGKTNGPVPPVVYKPFDGSEEWRNGPNQDFEPPEKLFRTWIRSNGKQVRRAEYNADPEAINKGFEVPESARKRTANDLVNAALEKVRDYYSVLVDPKSGERVRKPVPEWMEGWARVIYDFDAYSMWGFLSAVAGLDDSSIEAAGTIENLTSRLPLSFFHSFLGRSDINPKATYWEIAGGTDRLTEALKERVLAAGVELAMGQRMIRLEYWHAERDPGRRREVGPEAHRCGWRPSPRTTRRRSAPSPPSARSSPSPSPASATCSSSRCCRTRSGAPSSSCTTTRPPRCCSSSAAAGGSSPTRTGSASSTRSGRGQGRGRRRRARATPATPRPHPTAAAPSAPIPASTSDRSPAASPRSTTPTAARGAPRARRTTSSAAAR